MATYTIDEKSNLLGSLQSFHLGDSFRVLPKLALLPSDHHTFVEQAGKGAPAAKA
ncbi:hypothetical protein [Peribacillus sp. SI8-4]|uniref:hypothetical protein n=1 Tax=Peribacillus sp. SI8-4 TaxID=3048009 RepID=UPI0025555694|nr:hypothetical protein [Peribacillus sp. SI8-4]